MAVRFEDMMREVFTRKERATIRRTAARIAKRHMELKTRAKAKRRAA